MGNKQQDQKFTKNICTSDDEQHGPKTEQQSNKELNDHLHQSSFPKTLDINMWQWVGLKYPIVTYTRCFLI